MYRSKLKLTLHWLLIIVAMYIFWALAYLIFVKFASSEFNSLIRSPSDFWSEINASYIFWFVIFVFGIFVVQFVLKKAARYAPYEVYGALIFTILVMISVAIIVVSLIIDKRSIDTVPHLVINGLFLIPLVKRVYIGEGHTMYGGGDEEYNLN